jgi:hypothetical protein
LVTLDWRLGQHVSVKSLELSVRTLIYPLDVVKSFTVRTFNEMKKPAKRGRPPLPARKVKQGRLYCRLLESEEKEIEEAATRAGETKSEWIRRTLLDTAREH